MLSRLFGKRTRAIAAPADHPYSAFFERFQPDGLPVSGASTEEMNRCEQLLNSPLPASLRRMLSYRNGGSFGRGLFHLMGATRPYRHADLASWNHPALWKATFETINLEPLIFFADDIFGNQFGYLPGDDDPSVWRFDIQEGELLELASSITEFFTEVLPKDGSWLLGADFRDAYDETVEHREVGRHLGLVTPSLLGGSLAQENLQQMDPWVNLYVTGQVVSKIKPLPSGTEIRGLVVDPGTLAVSVGVR